MESTPLFCAAILALAFATMVSSDMMRKSIVFNMKTPKVFYCPQEKPTDMDKMIVKARPLDKLCEYDGKGLPKHSKSDCYNDIDETEYACAEKQRIMTRIDSSNNETAEVETQKPTKFVKPKKW